MKLPYTLQKLRFHVRLNTVLLIRKGDCHEKEFTDRFQYQAVYGSTGF